MKALTVSQKGIFDLMKKENYTAVVTVRNGIFKEAALKDYRRMVMRHVRSNTIAAMIDKNALKFISEEGLMRTKRYFKINPDYYENP